MKIQNLSELLKLVIESKASDLHLSSGLPPLIRVNDDLVPIPDMPNLNATTIKNLIYNMMEKSLQHQFETDLDLDFSIHIPDLVNCRVNLFYNVNGLAAVLRIIPSHIPTLDQLNLPAIFKRLVNLSHGLILVTGSTGSGKSTTLAALIDYINTHKELHIVTIEDPIEFIHTSKKSLVNQREVYRHTKKFPSALRAALRQDPDIILVGEMRDLETIRLALTAAETGHLVLATLHTHSAPRAVHRIVDVFPASEKNSIRNMLSESLQAVICQTLVKKIIGGRVAAFEIMLGTPAIRNIIREDKIAQIYSVMQTGREIGMCTLDQYLQKLVSTQIINDEARLLATSSNSLIC